MYAINSHSPLDIAMQLVQQHRSGFHKQPIRPTATTETLRQGFHIELTQNGRSPDAVIELLSRAARPGLVGNTDENFYGWVMGASSDVGVAADMLTSAWGQNAGIYQTAPSAAIAEEAASRWLLDLLDLPGESSIGFTTGATMASFIGLAAARFEVLRRHGWSLHEDGMMGAPVVQVFVSAEAHASVLAVLQYLGFGRRHLTRIPTDSQGRMSIASLARAMASSTGKPAIVIAQAGHINSGSFDRAEEIAELAEQHNAWFHIDGAFGLWARASTGYKRLTKGIDRADSWAVDGHKWLQVPYDSGYAIVRHADAHRHAMSISASYLNRESRDGRNPSDYVPELSRRARGFSTWAILQSLGSRGISTLVERHCHCAALLAKEVSNIEGVRVLNDVCLNQIAITFDDDVNIPMQSTLANSATTDAVIHHVQQRNQCFVSGANWKGHRIMRVSIISDKTGPDNIRGLVSSIREAWTAVRSKRSEYIALAQCG